MEQPELCCCEASELYQRLGEITRRLHEALRELGHDKRIQASLGALPDAKARLGLIARLTGEAAEKVLNNVDAAKANQDSLVRRATEVEALLSAGDAAAHGEVLRFLAEVRTGAEATGGQLTEIMLAQDFHDLTGQTVRKVVEVAASLEEALLGLLLEYTPPAVADRDVLDGPVADAGRTDVVSSQKQVDDLLESLGF